VRSAQHLLTTTSTLQGAAARAARPAGWRLRAPQRQAARAQVAKAEAGCGAAARSL
jgi:hypothetical protein